MGITLIASANVLIALVIDVPMARLLLLASVMGIPLILGTYSDVVSNVKVESHDIPDPSENSTECAGALVIEPIVLAIVVLSSLMAPTIE
jgi:hypothetical protein